VLLHLSTADRVALRPDLATVRLNQLGLDSLTTVQLRNRLLVDFAADVPAEVLLGGATGGEVVELVCEQLLLASVLADDSAGDPADDAAIEVLTI
jgi:acyl carrier protein